MDVRSHCYRLLVQYGRLQLLPVTQVNTHTHTVFAARGPPRRQTVPAHSPLLRPGCRGERERDKMRHKQVDGCSLFSALASAVSLNLCLILTASHCLERSGLCTRTRARRHTGTCCPGEIGNIGTQAPVTETCTYPCIFTLHSLSQKHADICWKECLMAVISVIMLAHTYNWIALQSTRASAQTNKLG